MSLDVGRGDSSSEESAQTVSNEPRGLKISTHLSNRPKIQSYHSMTGFCEKAMARCNYGAANSCGLVRDLVKAQSSLQGNVIIEQMLRFLMFSPLIVSPSMVWRAGGDDGGFLDGDISPDDEEDDEEDVADACLLLLVTEVLDASRTRGLGASSELDSEPESELDSELGSSVLGVMKSAERILIIAVVIGLLLLHKEGASQAFNKEGANKAIDLLSLCTNFW